MTLNEAITEGLLVTAVGLIIVFSVLAILMIALIIMKKVFYKPDKSLSEKDKDVSIENLPVADSETLTKETDCSEIVAVITAAIAATLNTSVYNLKIRSYKRVSNSSPAWNKAGVSEMLNTRL